MLSWALEKGGNWRLYLFILIVEINYMNMRIHVVHMSVSQICFLMRCCDVLRVLVELC
jgi:hypothetical protein